MIAPAAAMLAGCNPACCDPVPALPTCALTVTAAPASVTLDVLSSTTVTPTGTKSSACGTVTRLWSSSNSAIAAVSGQGVVTGIAVGATSVRVTDRNETDGTSASADVPVNVVAPVVVSISGAPSAIDIGASVQLTAVATGGSSPSVTWTSNAPTVISVSAGGLATALAIGTATLTATSTASPGRSASVRVNAAVQVGVSPSSAALSIGGVQQFTASVSGAVNKGVSWTSSNPSVVSVTAAGVATAIASGSASIVATSLAAPSRTGSATVTVTSQNAVASLQPIIVPATEGGTTRQITVVPLDATGNALANRSCTWQSAAPAVATVTSPGMTTTLSVVASLADTATIVVTVTCEGVSRAVSINVFPTPVASVTVTFDSTSLYAGEHALARVVLRGAQNQVLNGRLVRWSVSDMTKATVPPGSAWIACAVENQTCAFTGTRIVRYGTNGTYAFGEFTGGTMCNNAVFGDPVPNVLKGCDVADLATTTSGTGGLDVTGVRAGAVTLTARAVVNPNGVSGTVTVTVVPARSP